MAYVIKLKPEQFAFLGHLLEAMANGKTVIYDYEGCDYYINDYGKKNARKIGKKFDVEDSRVYWENPWEECFEHYERQ